MKIRTLVVSLALALSGAAFAGAEGTLGHTSVLSNGGATTTAFTGSNSLPNPTGTAPSVTADMAAACPASDKASLVCFFKGLPQGKNTRKCDRVPDFRYTNFPTEIGCLAERATVGRLRAVVLAPDYAGQDDQLWAAMASAGFGDHEYGADAIARFVRAQSDKALDELLDRADDVLGKSWHSEESSEEGEGLRYWQGW